jgi:hypothetical protein
MVKGDQVRRWCEINKLRTKVPNAANPFDIVMIALQRFDVRICLLLLGDQFVRSGYKFAGNIQLRE